MSANRSVQAAQRRRAGPPEPATPSRGPQPSINSSQMFAAGQQQQRMGPGSGQVSGRLAGQQAQQMQKNMMEQQQQQMQQPTASGLANINKMTLAQAITLITLRLGKVETQLFNGLGQGQGQGQGQGSEFTDDEDHILVDKQVIQSLISRIDVLEKRSATTVSSGSNQDIALLKQQFDTIKPIVVQSKTMNNTFKQQIEGLKTELVETKELLSALQNLTMDNSNKILAFSSIYGMNNNSEEMFLEDDADDAEEEMLEESDVVAASEEIVGTNLKELIEQEFNSEA
jgi:hypothetical protein